MLTLMGILAVASLVASIMEAMGKCPSFVAPLLLSVFACLQVIPK